jgi:hypothetical protein
MPDPLSSHKDRQLDVELDLAHFERRGVGMPHEVADQSRILSLRSSPSAVRHSGRLHYRIIIAHVVHDPNKSVIKDRELAAKNLIERGNCWARRPGWFGDH